MRPHRRLSRFPVRSRTALPLLLAAAGLLAAAAAAPPSAPSRGQEEETAPRAWTPWELDAPRPVTADLAEQLDVPADFACAECHAEVVAEWSRSLHALAWVDELYQDELEGLRKPESCHGCHIPEPLIGAGVPRKPRPRAEDPHLGVGCATCHLGPDGETIHGPWGLPNDAHASVRDPLFGGEARDDLCIACHATNVGPVLGVAKDYELAGVGASGRSCVGCHMRVVERPLSGQPGATRPGREHALQTPRDPAFLRRAFGLSARAEDGRTLVRVENLAGHRVPGLIGRRLRLRAEVLDEGGEVLGSGELELDHRAHLPAEEAAELAVDAVGASVRVTGTHSDPRLLELVDFLDEVLAPGG